MQVTRLNKSWQVLFFLTLLFTGLYFAKPILAPLFFAGLLSLLLLPMSRFLENKGWPKWLAIMTCILSFLLLCLSIIALITWQLSDLVADLGSISDKVASILDDIKSFIENKFSIKKAKQEEMIQETSNLRGWITSFGAAFFNTLFDILLIIVYVFMMMFYRNHLKQFILKLIPNKENRNAEVVIRNIEKMAQKYIVGMGIMIASLWVMYGIGFSIIGLENALFFAVLCGLFEIIPFVGNLIGNILAMLMALTQGGGLTLVLSVFIIYTIIQGIQSYIIQPLVVGGEVNINPLFTILSLILGELLWGISGMILALPLLAIVKIICDHVDELKPYGFLLGNPYKKKRKPIRLKRK